MFIIEKPYASEFLIDTIVQNDWFVLDNKAIRDANIEEGALNLISSDEAAEHYLKQEYPLIYANSENAISWVLNNLPQSNTSAYIKLFKDKIEFRNLLKELYPNFYFREISYDDLFNIKDNELRYPFVIKPAVGFLSLGVHTVYNKEEWQEVLKNIRNEMNRAVSLYPQNVINSSKYIIEELIDGDEYAIDAYYDRNGEPVILNVFQHPFLNKEDVRDRIYIISTEIMIKYMARFNILLRDIGNMRNIRNFPIHIEVRVTNNSEILPIEINPMRFAGWCTTDVAKYAWGINTYEYFHYQKHPDWNEILPNAKNEMYYFSMAEVPVNIDRKKINGFDYERFLSNYSNVLELRQIDYTYHPLFAVIFGSTTSKNEINRILSLNTKDFILNG